MVKEGKLGKPQVLLDVETDYRIEPTEGWGMTFVAGGTRYRTGPNGVGLYRELVTLEPADESFVLPAFWSSAVKHIESWVRSQGA